MRTEVVLKPGSDLREFVELFEKAWTTTGPVEIEKFLPPKEDPLYLLVLRELVCTDIDFRWQKRNPAQLREYETRFPDLFEHPEFVREVQMEDYRQRVQHGEIQNAAPCGEERALGSWLGYPPTERGAARVGSDNYLSGMAFNPEGEEELRDLIQDHSQVEHQVERTGEIPAAGNMFLGFRLIEELGRGAFSRVHFAHQIELANRPVALKISTEHFQESQLLAQLQHTNIMPIYSVHRFGRFHAICMPYLGSMTLADVLKTVRRTHNMPRTGRVLLSTGRPNSISPSASQSLSQVADSHAEMVPTDATSEQGFTDPQKAMDRMSYQQAVLWLGERLADGLAHAHSRGILHRDIKPANILLTDAGEPLLLDFNLSQEAHQDSSAAALLGGTLPYMAPEHLRAFDGEEQQVTEQADIYSLGLILYELATGHAPYSVPRGSRREIIKQMILERDAPAMDPRRLSSQVTPAMAAILKKCIEPRAQDRYCSAKQLQEDLARQREHLPLLHIPEPSWMERSTKWRRRHPRMAWAACTAMALLLCIGMTLLFITEGARREREERRRLQLQAQRDFTDFQGRLPEIQFLLNDDRAGESTRFREANRLVKKAMEPFGGLQPKLTTGFRFLTADQQAKVRADAGELLLLIAQAKLMQATALSDANAMSSLQQALDFHEQAQVLFDSQIPKAYWLQRAEILSRMGQKSAAAAATKQAESTPVRGGRDRYLLAICQARAGKAREAMALLEKTVQDDPRNFWAWFLKGHYHYRIMQDSMAVSCYSVCIALEPHLYGPYLERGLALYRQRSFHRARLDFDRVLELRANHPGAYLNRALAWEGQGNYLQAIEDFTHALQLKPEETRLYFLRAKAKRRAGDLPGAKLDEAMGLKESPVNEMGYVARGLALQPDNPEGALADYQQALKINPCSPVALQNIAAVLSERLNRTDESLQYLDRLLKLYPYYLPAHRGRGVLLARKGKRDEAHAAATKILDLARWQSDDPLERGKTWYYAACIYALTSTGHPKDQEAGLEALSSALRRGFGYNYIEKDPDLNPLRGNPDFQRLVVAAKAMKKKKSRAQ